MPATAPWLLWRLPAEDNDSLQGIATRFDRDRILHFLVDVMCRWDSGFVSGAEHLWPAGIWAGRGTGGSEGVAVFHCTVPCSFQGTPLRTA